MLRGIAAGSLTLIVLYVFVQRGTSDKVQSGGNLLVSGLRRALSGDVAGVPQRRQPAAAGGTTTGGGATTGQATGQLHLLAGAVPGITR